MQEIKVELTKQPKAKPTDETKLGFGSIFTDHMFVMNYDEGQGWHDARIVPYGPIELDPSAMCLHYGQTVFEGMKAYRAKDGRVLLFRPEKNMARLNVSNERLCIPKIDEAFALKCIEKLNLKPEEVIYIGDAQSDYEASKNAHIDFGLAKWGSVATQEIPATLVFKQPKDLLRLLKK